MGYDGCDSLPGFTLCSVCGLRFSFFSSRFTPCVGLSPWLRSAFRVWASLCVLRVRFSSLRFSVFRVFMRGITLSLRFSVFRVIRVWASLLPMSLQCQTAVSDSPAYDLSSRLR